jgi:hypothetical protein
MVLEAARFDFAQETMELSHDFKLAAVRWSGGGATQCPVHRGGQTVTREHRGAWDGARKLHES